MGRITKHNWTLVRHAAGGAALLGFCISIGAARAADANVQVAPCGLRVVGEGYGGDNGLRPFNWAPGVTVALMVTAPDGGLIELDDDACKMEKLVDDKGTNLLVDPQYSRAGISGMADVSDDGKALLAEINGGGVPVKGASSIHAVGAIAVRCAKEKKSHKAENVAVKADEKAAAGPVTFTLKEVGKPDWGDKPLRILALRSTCACTVPGIQSDTIQPGESITIELELDANSATGATLRYIMALIE
ncbi:MAG TPA: DUF1573 domain-containing protein, partial [Phycisphaerae bacterium]|nr:DUF1573 domain-containing protein [Phycisphaerae bacterium]